MAYPLSDKIVAAELQRAKTLEIGQPKVPGLDKSVKVGDTLRFPDYHEPLGLDRWPFLADPLLEKIRKHGRHPPLLTDMGRSKGVPNQRQTLHTGPSDRIGSHLTPTAKHLRLKAIREERIRKARMRQLMREDGLLMPKGIRKPELKFTPAKKAGEYTKFGKLVSRPPRKPRYVLILASSCVFQLGTYSFAETPCQVFIGKGLIWTVTSYRSLCKLKSKSVVSPTLK